MSGDDLLQQLEKVLGGFVSTINARSILRLALERSNSSPNKPSAGLADAVMEGCRLYVRDPDKYATLSSQVQSVARGSGRSRLSSVDVEIRAEPDIVTARGLSRQLAERMGFAHLQQVQISTVVSELARNVVRYAGTGRIRLHPHEGPKARLEVVAEDSGPGITNLDEILSGKYTSRTGLGKGLLGCRQIMDEFDVRTAPGIGTVVRCVKVVA